MTNIDAINQLDQFSFERSYKLGHIAGTIGRAHIDTKELREITEDNIQTEIEMIERFKKI